METAGNNSTTHREEDETSTSNQQHSMKNNILMLVATGVVVAALIESAAALDCHTMPSTKNPCPNCKAENDDCSYLESSLAIFCCGLCLTETACVDSRQQHPVSTRHVTAFCVGERHPTCQTQGNPGSWSNPVSTTTMVGVDCNE